MRLLALRLVDDDVSDVAEHLLLFIIYLVDIDELRVRSDESCVALAGDECRMVQYVQQERDVRLYAVDVCLT